MFLKIYAIKKGALYYTGNDFCKTWATSLEQAWWTNDYNLIESAVLAEEGEVIVSIKIPLPLLIEKEV